MIPQPGIMVIVCREHLSTFVLFAQSLFYGLLIFRGRFQEPGMLLIWFRGSDQQVINEADSAKEDSHREQGLIFDAL